MSATNTGKSQINVSILVHLHMYISVYSKYKFPAKLLHLATKIEKKKKLETFKPGKYLPSLVATCWSVPQSSSLLASLTYLELK